MKDVFWSDLNQKRFLGTLKEEKIFFGNYKKIKMLFW
jgi:hypothetical protein